MKIIEKLPKITLLAICISLCFICLILATPMNTAYATSLNDIGAMSSK